VAKHPPNQLTTAAKHQPEVIFNQYDDGGKASARATAAKHPPDDDRHNPNDVDATERRQAQKQELSEESKRPLPPERRGGTRGKDDAFNKVSGAQGRRRHQPANGSMAFTSTQIPQQIRHHRNIGGYAGRHRAAGGHQEGGQRGQSKDFHPESSPERRDKGER